MSLISHQVAFSAPSPALAPYLAGFHSYDVVVTPGATHEEIFLPAWVNLRAQVAGGEWAMTIGTQNFDPVPKLALFGPTSQAGFARVETGRIIGVALMPRGWARLIGGDASTYADRIVPLDEVVGAEDSAALGTALAQSDDFAAQVAAFEDFLLRLLASRPAEPEAVGAIEALLLEPEVRSVAEAAARLGLPLWQFARIAKRHFGFAPKLLIRRARFVRTLLALRHANGHRWSALVGDAYVDQSHFIRDCHDFLGMTPGQFVARFQPVGEASLAERARVLGAEAQALHGAPRDD